MSSFYKIILNYPLNNLKEIIHHEFIRYDRFSVEKVLTVCKSFFPGCKIDVYKRLYSDLEHDYVFLPVDKNLNAPLFRGN